MRGTQQIAIENFIIVSICRSSTLQCLCTYEKKWPVKWITTHSLTFHSIYELIKIWAKEGNNRPTFYLNSKWYMQPVITSIIFKYWKTQGKYNLIIIFYCMYTMFRMSWFICEWNGVGTQLIIISFIRLLLLHILRLICWETCFPIKTNIKKFQFRTLNLHPSFYVPRSLMTYVDTFSLLVYISITKNIVCKK